MLQAYQPEQLIYFGCKMRSPENQVSKSVKAQIAVVAVIAVFAV